MPNSKFDEILRIFQTQRDELICKLVSFVAGDTILFLPKDSGCDEKIKSANEILGSRFEKTDGINVLSENLLYGENIKKYMNRCSVEKQTFIYLVATELRSVLAAVLLAEKEINAEEAFKFSFYEELTQQKKWGVLPEAEEKHQAVKLQLKALERWLNERSVS